MMMTMMLADAAENTHELRSLTRYYYYLFTHDLKGNCLALFSFA